MNVYQAEVSLFQHVETIFQLGNNYAILATLALVNTPIKTYCFVCFDIVIFIL